jgi:hypothetical protein
LSIAIIPALVIATTIWTIGSITIMRFLEAIVVTFVISFIVVVVIVIGIVIVDAYKRAIVGDAPAPRLHDGHGAAPARVHAAPLVAQPRYFGLPYFDLLERHEGRVGQYLL